MKGMGASLGYSAVSELAHRLEDRLGAWRQSGGIDDPQGVTMLFRGLESLERMVAVVRETSAPPRPDVELLAALDGAAPPKKAQRLP
jgi:chemotaxis protein histidine kinase CheA